MSRKRPAPDDYTGRHRIKTSASGGHRKDPLPPPDPPFRPPRTSLLSDEPTGGWSQWYEPSKLHGIDPDIIAPVYEDRPTRKLPLEPKRKIRPQYIVASVATALVAVPALLMAGYIANTQSTSSSQLSTSTVRMPIVLVVDGRSKRVCITLANSGPQWTASASGC